MCYVNMIIALGPRRFAGKLAAAGGAGAIVPDLPLEEASEIGEALEAEGLALVPLVAPTTPAERRKRICAAAKGFVYVVSIAGVTGERAELPAHLTELVRTVQEEAPVPAAVGFGIGTPEQAAAVGKVADGVIIGTRLVREVFDAADSAAGVESAAAFLREVRAAMDG
jgi:tryptophan synthase alpha chain